MKSLVLGGRGKDVELISKDSMEMGLAPTGGHVAGEINAGEVTLKPEKRKLKTVIPECQA